MPLTIPIVACKESNMKVRQIKQRHIVLMKRHSFKRMCERFKAASRLRRAQQTTVVELPIEGEFVWEEA